MLAALRDRYLAWRERNSVSLAFDELGFSVIRGGSKTSVRWQAITAVFAFKRDVITTDQVCVSFVCKGREVTVTEDMPGYENLVEQMEQRLGISPEWVLEVMFPAFETNLTQIYPPDVAIVK